MSRQPFRFKQFSVSDEHSAMKVNTDGVLLATWSHVPGKGRILDIGTGCGIIALILAQRSHCRIDAIDVHKGSVEDAFRNFENSPWPDRLFAYHSSLKEFAGSGRYDLVISNPPFFSKSLLSPEETKNIVRHDQSLRIQDLVEAAAKLLNRYGTFSVILPIQRFVDIDHTACRVGLHCRRKTLVFPRSGKPASRIMLEYSFNPVQKVADDALAILNSDNSYTREYRELTGDLYLNF